MLGTDTVASVMIPSLPAWRRWAILFGLGTLVPALLLLLVLVAGAPLDFGEPDKYVRVSQGLLSQGALVEERSALGIDVTGDPRPEAAGPIRFVPALERLPAYPIFVAALWAIAWPDSFLWIEVAQCLLGGLFAVAMAAAASALRPGWFWPAGLLACVWPNVQWQATMVMPEMLLATTLAGGLAAALWIPHARHPWKVASIAALGFAVAFMTKPQLLPLPLVLAPTLWWYLARAGMSPGRAAAVAALPVCAILAVAGMQTARVHAAHGVWLFTTHSNDHALFFVWPCLATPLGCGDPEPREAQRALTDFRARMAELPYDRKIDPIVQNEVKGALFREYLAAADKVAVARAIAGSYAKLMGHTVVLQMLERFDRDLVHLSTTEGTGLARIVTFVGRVGADPGMIAWAVAQLLLLATRAMQLIGFVGGVCDRRLRAAAIMLALCGAAVIVTAAGIGNPRYRVAAEPMLLLLTVMGGAAIVGRLRRR